MPKSAPFDPFRVKPILQPKGPRCSVGRLLDELPPAIAKSFREALELKSGWTSVEIARRLNLAYPLLRPPREHQVAKHRRGDCNCAAYAEFDRLTAEVRDGG